MRLVIQEAAMLNIKNIIVPIDFSKSSIEALRIANDIAGRYSAVLHIAHVVSSDSSIKTPLHPTQFDVVCNKEDEIEDAKNKLSEIIDKHVSKEVRTEVHVLCGDPAHKIIELIDNDESIDLLVIATHGRTGMQRFIFGSVTEKIIRHSKCAVLTIRSFDGRLVKKLI
jgi:nucleotide-binding universal stress UspA family protein